MSTELTPRVGFVGSGWTERMQIPAFRLGGLQAQAIASSRIENATRVAARFGIPEVYPTWQELIVSPNVDVVSIVTPPHLHKEIAIAALAAGKHVICEKPMALNLGEAEEMFAAAQAAPEQLAIIDHELRFHPMRIQMRQMIRDGAIGSVIRLTVDRLGPDRLDATAPWTWWADADQGGGMLGAVGSHLLDLGRWLVGRMDSITGQLQTGHYYRTDAGSGAERRVTSDDHASILVRYANGAQGSLVASGLTPGGFGMTTLVVGTEGALRLDNEDRLWIKKGDRYPNVEWEEAPARAPVGELEGVSTTNPFAVGSYFLAQTLAATLPMGETTLPEAASFYDGVVVQRALDAVRKSHRDGVWQHL